MSTGQLRVPPMISALRSGKPWAHTRRDVPRLRPQMGPHPPPVCLELMAAGLRTVLQRFTTVAGVVRQVGQRARRGQKSRGSTKRSGSGFVVCRATLSL
jgi:hypothetical protein